MRYLVKVLSDSSATDYDTYSGEAVVIELDAKHFPKLFSDSNVRSVSFKFYAIVVETDSWAIVDAHSGLKIVEGAITLEDARSACIKRIKRFGDAAGFSNVLTNQMRAEERVDSNRRIALSRRAHSKK